MYYDLDNIQILKKNKARFAIWSSHEKVFLYNEKTKSNDYSETALYSRIFEMETARFHRLVRAEKKRIISDSTSVPQAEAEQRVAYRRLSNKGFRTRMGRFDIILRYIKKNKAAMVYRENTLSYEQAVKIAKNS